MIRLLLLGVLIVCQCYGTYGCLPRRKELTDSYIPVGIQALNHYRSQLQMYYPYTFTELCKNGKHGVATPEGVCVAEALARINLFLIDLQREAAKQNLEHSQGFARSVLVDIRKTSRMTAAQQFHFILEKLRTEGIGKGHVGCKMADFIQDLENPNSKLFKNFLNIKPINYLD